MTDSPAPLDGSCLCGAVRYTVAGRLGPVVYCHCTQCRKASGTAFAANANARLADVTVHSGRDAIREYESSPGKFRAFCSRCGSPVYSRTTALPDVLRLRLGSLEQDPGRRSLAHCWVRSRAAWHEIADALPQFAEGPPPKPAPA